MTDTAPQPTARGIERYPPDGYRDGVPCTCKSDCPEACKGECGCEACCEAYGDFLSGPQ